MKRSLVWKAVWTALLSSSVASGQGPSYPPGVSPFGNPGYGVPQLGGIPYGPAAPNRSYAPAAPVQPYGNYVPNMPYGGAPPLPSGPAPTAPQYNGNGPKLGATEPYVVPPEPSAPVPTPAPMPTPLPMPAHQPSAAPGPGCGPECGPDGCLPTAGWVMHGPPPEPYTLHEGRRSVAEMKQDETMIWMQTSFIHWFVRNSPVPPMATTGDLALPRPGVVGMGNARTLIGDTSLAPNQFSGFQLYGGMWLDADKTVALEIGGFWVGQKSRQYGVASDPNGNFLVAQPLVIEGNEQALAIALPDLFTGRINVNSTMDFHAAEINLAFNSFRTCGWTFDYFTGFRYLGLHDALGIDQSLTVLPAGDGLIPFNRVPVPAGSNLVFRDSFDITNRFYGGQLGARLNWTHCRGFDLGATVKLGLGVTTHDVNINGSTTLNDVTGVRTTLPGGILAQASNSGQRNSSDFSVVPEINLTAGYQVTSHIRVLAGYNLLYWSRVMRVANQIDRNVDLTQSPTDANYNPNGAQTRPLFPGVRTEFWAQGVNVGLELKY